MRIVSSQNGLLRVLAGEALKGGAAATFSTRLPALDALAPDGALARGAIHEILAEPHAAPARSFALLLGRAAAEERMIVWSDPRRELYPPALAGRIDLDRLILLRPKNRADEIWALTECLRCRAVGATIAAPPRLSRIETRRMQLAAERGGGVGLLLRPVGPASAHYAAATRWLVRPARGEPNVQRWEIELIHGHGGRTGQSVILEVCRETGDVRAFEALADRPPAAKRTRVPA